MKRVTILLLAVLTVMAGVFMLRATPSEAYAQGSTESQWLTYTDPKFGFTVEYPREWRVIPRIDRDDAYGGVLRFKPAHSSKEDEKSDESEIVIGLHTLPLEAEQTLAEWTTQYLAQSSPFAPSERPVEQMSLVTVGSGNDLTALDVRGASPITKFRLVNIPRGETVWFLWATDDVVTAPIFERMLGTFRFSPTTPTTLSDAFGPVFQPQPRKASVDRSPRPEGINGVIGLPNSYWYVPTPAGGTYSVLCGSSYHTGTAAYAADVQVGIGTPVHATYHSWIDFAGWDTTGYGNLIKASTDHLFSRVYTAYYAHLNSFAASPGQEVGTTGRIAYSGDTGNGGPHLHFHVYSIYDAVDLSNLNTFNENGHYPSGYANCGTMTR